MTDDDNTITTPTEARLTALRELIELDAVLQELSRPAQLAIQQAAPDDTRGYLQLRRRIGDAIAVLSTDGRYIPQPTGKKVGGWAKVVRAIS